MPRGKDGPMMQMIDAENGQKGLQRKGEPEPEMERWSTGSMKSIPSSGKRNERAALGKYKRGYKKENNVSGFLNFLV